MSKEDLKTGLRSLRDALRDRQGELGLGPLTGRWSGAMLRAVGIGPARKRNAWAALPDQPAGGATVLIALETAASAVQAATTDTASAALTKAEGALGRLETLLGV